jgi:alpha-glucosidase
MPDPRPGSHQIHVAPPTSEWWRTAVIYQIYPRSFASANDDGIGDLPGITARLPYLRDLGVDAVWISPFYPSPQADAGYDVADYQDVDPLFGSLADADRLIATAHELGLRVFVDVVPNHTSDEHAWFQAALAAGPGSPERARYWFVDSDGLPNNWPSEFGGPAWSQIPDGQWCLHMFDRKQPDLNWENPEVRAMFLDVLWFWLDRGVDGFRVDVAQAVVKADGLPDFHGDLQAIFNGQVPAHTAPFYDQEGVHDIYRQWRTLLDSYPGERAMVAEAWVNPLERLARHVRSDEFHQAFNFSFLQTPWRTPDLRTCITEVLADQRRCRRTLYLGAVQPRRHPARQPARLHLRPHLTVADGRRTTSRPDAGDPAGPGGGNADAGVAGQSLHLSRGGTRAAGSDRPSC